LFLLQLRLWFGGIVMNFLLSFAFVRSSGGRELLGTSFFLFRLVQIGYVVMGVYHLYSQWIKERLGKPIHSHESGESYLSPFAGGAMRIANLLLVIPFRIMSLTLPKEERERFSETLPVFTDERRFTFGILEYVALNIMILLLGLIAYLYNLVTGGTIDGFLLVYFWLSISGFPLLIFNWSDLDDEWHRILNIRDNIIEGRFKRSGYSEDFDRLRMPSGMKDTLEYYAEEAAKDPEFLEIINQNSPSIADAMAAINPDLAKDDKTE